MSLQTILERPSHRRVLIVTALWLEFIFHKPLRRQIGWAVALYLSSVAVLAVVYITVHVAIKLLFRL
ncbi:hypothetical protein [Paraburkholderia sp. J63]|uniref:hypothetical protein n=1 Tax=Paraburkholderia sp. J63 TaxID=2805434 RepID=UPI002ABDD39C|nr:hypothetical protein [Paraburkholderia sp. J63]